MVRLWQRAVHTQGGQPQAFLLGDQWELYITAHFLSQVQELAWELQLALLRVLEERQELLLGVQEAWEQEEQPALLLELVELAEELPIDLKELLESKLERR